MNKTELVEAVKAKTKLTKKDAEAAVNAVFDTVVKEVAKGNKVALVGFGTFEARSRAARKGMNPATKQPISIPASKAPAFKAGKAFKDSVK